MKIADMEILRELARKKVEIATDPKNKMNETLWQRANDLHMIKPPVYINEVCWNEMNVDNELTLLTKDPFARRLEEELRREIYSWNHMPGNMVVSNYIECPMIIVGNDFDIEEISDIARTEETSKVVSRHFNIQISSIDDVYKIKDPVVRYEKEATMKNFALMQEIFGEIIEVRIVGKRGMWFTPWDYLIRWTGVEPVMYDLIEEPEYIEALVERYMDASISLLNQYKSIGAWASNNLNERVGSGGYGYSKHLEKPDGLDINAPLDALWGCGNAQIFAAVSEQMHWDFSLKYEMRWLENFGLTYYGCCEPLHNKMNILQKVPNLRKISASPWCDLKAMNEIVKGKYVMSCKPSPAIFCGNSFSEDYAREEIRKILLDSEGCDFELVMKDISTVDFKPQNLWRWSEIVQEEVDRIYT